MILAEPREDPRQGLGLAGEQAAAEALVRLGYRILDCRFRRRVGEIDIVAVDGDVVVFVEVKTRSGTGFGHPAEAITATKRRRMARAAQTYLGRKGREERPCRFDVVEVLAGTGRRMSVRHIEDAFRLGPLG